MNPRTDVAPPMCDAFEIHMTVRTAFLLAVVATLVSTAASTAARAQSRSPDAVTTASPKPFLGVPLTGSTGLTLLVADDLPVLLDVDTGRVTPIGGLNVHGSPVLSVLAVGQDAVVWLDRRTSADRTPAAEIYVVRHKGRRATRIATAWEVAPAANGQAVWLTSFKDARHCALREVALSGRQLRGRPIPCSTRLIDGGSGALLVEGSSVVDPLTMRTLLRTNAVWAVAGHYALTDAGCCRPLTVTDLRSGARRTLPWPSRIGGTDQAAVEPNGKLVAVDFADPAYGGGGTQVTDAWLLNPATGRLQHLPDMPADVALKFTSMSWTNDGRLVWLAQTEGHDVVAVWRPGEKRIAVRRVRLPVRDSGSDAFVVWTSTPTR
jgi:hypothetical protein